MQEYDENKAIKAMGAVLEESKRNADAISEVLDLIFDYYEENGDLDIDFDENDDTDDETDVDAVVAFVKKYLDKHPAEVRFSADEIKAMVIAELDYEESLL